MAAAETAERRRGRINDDRGKKIAAARTGKSVASVGRRKKSRPLRSADPRRRALRKNGAGSQKSAAREPEATEVGAGPDPSRQKIFSVGHDRKEMALFPDDRRFEDSQLEPSFVRVRAGNPEAFGNEAKLVTRARGCCPSPILVG